MASRSYSTVSLCEANLIHSNSRIDLEQGDVGGKGVSFAVSGNLDYSQAEPRLALGLAAQQMSVTAFGQVWPIMLSNRVRAWGA